MSHRTTVLLWMILLARFSYAGAYAYHPASPLKLGGGFNKYSATQEFPPCLDMTDGTYPSAPGAGQISFETKLLERQQDMFSLLKIDAHLSARYKFANVSSSFSMEDQVTFHSDDLVWVVRAYQDFGKISLRAVKLNSEALKRKGNRPKFYAYCGLEYVQEVQRIAQLAAVFTMHNLSNQEKHNLQLHFAGGVDMGPTGGVSVSGDFQKFLQEALKVRQVNLSVYGIGGGGVKELASLALSGDNIDEVRKVLSTYIGTLTPENAAYITFLTGHFASFVGGPTDPADSPQLDALYFSYNDALKKFDRLHSIVLGGDADYAYLTDSQMQDYRDLYAKLATRVGTIHELGSKCLERGGKCDFPDPNPPVIDWPVNPELNCSSWRRGLCLQCTFPVFFSGWAQGGQRSFQCTHLPMSQTALTEFNGYVVIDQNYPDNKVWNGGVRIRLANTSEDCTSIASNTDHCKDAHLGSVNAGSLWRFLHVDRTQHYEQNQAAFNFLIDECHTGPDIHAICDSVPPGQASAEAPHSLPPNPAPAVLTISVRTDQPIPPNRDVPVTNVENRKPSSCQYAGDTYADNALKTNEVTCQRCQDGTWFDANPMYCRSAEPPSPIQSQPPTEGRYCVDDTGKSFSDRAIKKHLPQCQRCQLVTWGDVASDFCSVAPTK